MPVEVKLPTILRSHAEGRSSVATDGETVGALFGSLVARYPGLGEHLLDEEGGLHRFVNVYVNDEDIRYLGQLDTPVADGDVVSIIPAVAGGA